MKTLFILMISIATLLSCSKNGDKKSELKIRLSNTSQYDYKDIKVNTSSGNVNFEDIKAGEKTEYQNFKIAYNYAFVELKIDSETYTLQPLDYVGETPIKKGNYTYKIDANDSKDQYSKLSLKLVKE